MLCSVIIPLYNKAAFVEDALRSVLNQTYQDFEIIVVDDGSTDDGVARVRAINDDRIVLVQQANGGVSRARNQGIVLAQGDVVCFLDADDWYLPQYLDTVMTLVKNYPALAFFATSYKLVNVAAGDEKFWQVSNNAPIEIIDDIFCRWRFDILFNIDSVAVRRSFLTQFQPCFPEGEQMGEDQDLFFRLAEKSSIAYCPSQLTAYRMAVGESLCALYQGDVLFPAHLRLEQRALNRQLPDSLRKSALRLVTEARISSVRTKLMAGLRYQGFKQLLGIWRGVVSRRWWVSLLMCACVSPSMVQRWEYWRIQRACKQ